MTNWENNNRNHRWKLDESGKPDSFGVEYDYHNGPICEACGYCFCEWCEPDAPKIDCNAIIEGEFKETAKMLK